MQPEIFLNDTGVLAMTSEASIDFTPMDFDRPLTHTQREYLRVHLGRDILQVFWRKQVHGDQILEARGSARSSKGCPDADAFITDEKDLPIAIRTADCVPIFIFDPVHRVIGLAHAGWQGTYKSIGLKTVQKMKAQYASDPAALKIVLGPGIRECCYQVGEEFRGFFPSQVSQKAEGLYLDVIKANQEQLLAAGVRPENIFDSGQCTCCNKKYFSYRRDGSKAGRMISLMMLR